MWDSIKSVAGKLAEKNCAHDTLSSTDIAGMTRTACHDCGRIQLDFTRDVFETLHRELDLIPAS